MDSVREKSRSTQNYYAIFVVGDIDRTCAHDSAMSERVGEKVKKLLIIGSVNVPSGEFA